jgi:hypothetical protein
VGPLVDTSPYDVVAVPGQGSLVYVSTSMGITQCSTLQKDSCKNIVDTTGTEGLRQLPSLWAVNILTGVFWSTCVLLRARASLHGSMHVCLRSPAATSQRHRHLE